MPQVHQVIVHSPGRNWQAGVAFQEQPGVGDHVGYFSGLLEDGMVFAGGPFIDGSGGMFIMAAELSKEDAEHIASADPAVTGGLLEAQVRPWLRAMIADPTS